MHPHSSPLYATWLPALISFAAAVYLGWCLLTHEAFLFLYPQSEALNWLYARVYMQENSFAFSGFLLSSVQNINLLLVGLLLPAVWLDLPPYSSLWLWQTVINTLLLFRAAQLFTSPKNKTLSRVSYGLFFANPFLWYALLCLPSQVLTAWLLAEWMLQRKSNSHYAPVCLFFLSACGSLGFLLAVALCVSHSIHSRFHSRSPFIPWGLSWVAVLPATVLYAVLTLNHATPAGTYLPEMPALLTAWLPFGWLSFQAHENLTFFLLWIGNGAADEWIPLPLFGLFSWLGILDSIHNRRFILSFWVLICIGLAYLCFTVPIDPSTQSLLSLPLILFLIPFAAKGLTSAASSFHPYRTEAAVLLTVAVLFLGWIRQPSVWEKRITQAHLLSDIRQNIQTVLEPFSSETVTQIALPFHPSLYAAIPSDTHNLSLIPSHFVVQTHIPTPTGTLSGFRINLIQTLQLQPDLILQLPDAVYQKEQNAHSFLSIPFIHNILETHYQKHRLKQVTYYQKKKSTHTDSSLFKPLFDPKKSSIILSSKKAQNQPPAYHIDRNPFTQKPGWMQWEMEQTYLHAESYGFAFKNAPNPALSAAGVAAAVSGLQANRKFTGVLQSTPFIIQGDEMSFYANLPQDASPTLFCLAVQQKIAPNDEQNPPKLRHIFDHPPAASLVEDTHYYIKPEELHYEPDGIYGWKVVRALHGEGKNGWQWVEWSLHPWKGKQAVWMAADRDRKSWLAVDHIIQSRRPSGIYWDFESGGLSGWVAAGKAFQDNPSTGSQGSQLPVSGTEGNYFINSYFDGSDKHTGTLSSPQFTIEHNHLSFRVGGGDDTEVTSVTLFVDEKPVFKTAGEQSETLRRVHVDLSKWINRHAQIRIIDHASGSWGHILADDFRIYTR